MERRVAPSYFTLRQIPAAAKRERGSESQLCGGRGIVFLPRVPGLRSIRKEVFQYFGTVTLTTVGFGDIVPVTPAARLVTGLEAMAGQLYLAVVIATLVGRVASARRE